MAKKSKFQEGWEAAREHYQTSNSVPPCPPGYTTTDKGWVELPDGGISQPPPEEED